MYGDVNWNSYKRKLLTNAGKVFVSVLPPPSTRFDTLTVNKYCISDNLVIYIITLKQMFDVFAFRHTGKCRV